MDATTLAVANMTMVALINSAVATTLDRPGTGVRVMLFGSALMLISAALILALS